MSANRTGKGIWISVIIVLLVVVISMLGVIWLIPNRFGEPTGPGVFGDMFGAVNALFSGLALGGVVVAIVFQSRELSLQREELVATRGELHEQRKQMALQQSTLHIQQFENTFFHCLDLINSVVQTMTYGEWRGRRCFIGYKNEVNYYMRIEDRDRPGQGVILRVANAYSRFYNEDGYKVGHYFRTLYNTIQYINESVGVNKEVYSGMLRSQISEPELEVLVLDGLAPNREKFKALIEQFGLLKHAPEVLLDLDSNKTKEIYEKYDKSAFR